MIIQSSSTAPLNLTLIRDALILYSNVFEHSKFSVDQCAFVILLSVITPWLLSRLYYMSVMLSDTII